MKIKYTVKLMIIILFLLPAENLLAENKYFEEGKSLFQLKKFDIAKTQFEKDIVFNPKNEMSYLYLAKIFNKKEKNLLEENNLTTVLLLNPENEEAIYYLTLLNIKKSNFKRSKELIEKLEKVCKNLCNKKVELKKKLNNSLK
jgi:tetratricopeptide (TPR) repeat protein